MTLPAWSPKHGRDASVQGGLQRRRKAEQDTGDDRKSKGEGKNAGIGRGLNGISGDAGGQEGKQPAHHDDGKRGSGECAADRQHNTFGDELSNDPSAAGTECEPHRDFFLPRGPARGKQAREIGAGNQENEDDHAHQHQQRRFILTAEIGIALRARHHVKGICRNLSRR